MLTTVRVVKLGGNAVSHPEWLNPMLAGCRRLWTGGHRLVLVHGAGPQTDELLGRLGIPIRKVNGRRITDAPTLAALKMACAGLVNTELVSAALGHGLPALGISAVSGRIAAARRRPRVTLVDRVTGRSRPVDFGLVGDIRRVNRNRLEKLLAAGFLPVVACLAAGPDGRALNVNADALAAALAGSLRAERLVYVTDVTGVRTGNDTLTRLNLVRARELIASGRVTGGMVAKLECAASAIGRGVKQVNIVGTLTDTRQWQTALAGCGHGTVLTRR